MNPPMNEIVCKTSKDEHHCVPGEYTLVWGRPAYKEKWKRGKQWAHGPG